MLSFIKVRKKIQPAPTFLKQRNEAVKFINDYDRKQWKGEEDYHKRSLNEVGMMRYKTTFTDEMQARKFENQQTEAAIKCKILNTFRDVGMPLSHRV